MLGCLWFCPKRHFATLRFLIGFLPLERHQFPAMERLAFGGLAAAAILRRHIVGLGKSAVAENEPQPGSDDAEVKLEQNNILSLEQIVNIAGQLAQYVRAEYIFGPTKLVFEKEDTSPVTVADLAIQVLVTTLLKHIQRTDDKIRLVGEESPAMFTDGANAEAMEVIVELVARFLPSGVAESPISADFVMQALAEGNDQGGDGTFWTLDPIDGTKGFVLEGGQYAIGLALVQEGRVVRSVIGCPVLSSAYVLGDPRQQGCIYSATRGGGAFVHAVEDDGSLGPAKPCRVPAAPQNRSVRSFVRSCAPCVLCVVCRLSCASFPLSSVLPWHLIPMCGAVGQ